MMTGRSDFRKANSRICHKKATYAAESFLPMQNTSGRERHKEPLLQLEK